MKLSRMVHLLRLHLNDIQKIGWPDDEELIEYLDRASTFLTDRLIAMRYNQLLKWLELDGPTQLPEDFVTFMGKVPVQIVGTTAEHYGRVDIRTKVERWGDPNYAPTKDTPMWGGAPIEDYESWEDLTTTKKARFLYWSRLPYPSAFALEDELPYQQFQSTLILDLARMFALNKNEYDLTQDIGLMGQIQQAMAQARGVADSND